jgi:hypothetical protein
VKKNTTPTTNVAAKKIVNNGTIEYVLPLGGNGWMVKNNKAAKFTVITDSKKEAISITRGIKQIQLVIYGRDGNIEKSESYIA